MFSLAATRHFWGTVLGIHQVCGEIRTYMNLHYIVPPPQLPRAMNIPRVSVDCDFPRVARSRYIRKAGIRCDISPGHASHTNTKPTILASHPHHSPRSPPIQPRRERSGCLVLVSISSERGSNFGRLTSLKAGKRTRRACVSVGFRNIPSVARRPGTIVSMSFGEARCGRLRGSGHLYGRSWTVRRGVCRRLRQ